MTNTQTAPTAPNLSSTSLSAGQAAASRSGHLHVILLVTAAILLALPACSGVPTPVPYARPYPALTQSQALNIQVFRTTKHLELTNTTARAFGPSTLWLNARFSRPIDGLGVGQSLKLRLEEFRDEYSDVFRGGGFFSTEAPERLVLAQIETVNPDAKPDLVGLIVVKGKDE